MRQIKDVSVAGLSFKDAMKFVSIQERPLCVRFATPLAEGDVIIVNDPYFGGTHLMDVRMVKPFYYRGELWAYLSNTGHWSDTGGMVPGGFCATATEIQQEGRAFRRCIWCVAAS